MIVLKASMTLLLKIQSGRKYPIKFCQIFRPTCASGIMSLLSGKVFQANQSSSPIAFAISRTEQALLLQY